MPDNGPVRQHVMYVAKLTIQDFVQIDPHVERLLDGW